MENVPPPAQELVLLDRELARLDARRAQLLARRAWLLGVLYPATPSAPPRAARETTPRSAQNVLLTLGGLLLAVAAVAFTLVSWGHLGIGGRAAVLGAVTVAALAAPVALLRRGLASTAESVAALGLLLTVLDAYALHRVALPGTEGLGYAAVASGVLAALWTAYGLGARRLRVPLPAAVVAGQLPLPLGALAADAGALSLAWAALLTAAAGTALALWARPAAAVRWVACGAACAAGAWAVLSGGRLSLVEGGAGPAALLLAAAGLALYAAWHAPAAVACASAAGLLAVAGAGGLAREALPQGWAVPGYLLCAVAVAAAARRGPVPRGAAVGLLAASAVVQALSVVWAAAFLVPALVRPGQGVPWPVPVVLLTVAAALAVPRRAEARSGAVALATAAALSLPAALGLPSTGTAVSHLVLTAALLSLMVRPAVLTRGLPAPQAQAGPATGAVPAADREVLGYVALVCALVSAGGAALAVAGRGPAGVVVPGVVAALFAGAAPFARGTVRAVAACTGVLAAAGCAGAGSALASLPAHHAALALLCVPAATAVAGALLRRHPVALPVESAGAAVALVALALPVARPAYLALVLALCGIVASATALRPERRPAAGYAATALFVAATWVRLAVSEVSAPEAYALPVAVPALVVGVLRRRRVPEASSWAAYGPGLGTALVPSLVAAWGDPDWPRPLLLGAGALAVTLVGARWRLQAPLVLGGSVLGLVALHELAPYIVQVMGALPRWLPPALAGLLLLAAGATYEQRLRDARRLRETLGRMR
ncbi:SCO7613 C-terminal domain-containing membrane protein [Streptomyces sp. NPDC051310]|uniref:SCO7613 C-terminal domain-containing membrane protein n=1 Tax=Streptomyces sp. NPDC051310 TaxID=3365649 RepID=UPI0037BDB3A0